MTAFFIFIHCAACVLLVVLILMQSGRGGGLTESFASAESMFGAKTNEVMVRATTVVAFVFLVTSLSLAYFSARQDRSLVETNIASEKTVAQSIPETQAQPQQTLPEFPGSSENLPLNAVN